MRVDYKDVIKKRAPKCFCCREQFELHRGHNDDSILFFDNHFFHKKCFVEKNKIIRLCHECKQEIELLKIVIILSVTMEDFIIKIVLYNGVMEQSTVVKKDNLL